MSKDRMSIDTLPDDIYKVLEDGVKFSTEDIEQFTKMLAHRLDPANKQGKGLRMSNFGTPCDRKLWYLENMPDQAEPFSGQVKLKFMYGDIIETLILMLAQKAGHEVEGMQDEVEINGVKGHRDGIFDGMTADVKSANSRGMTKFKQHQLESDDPFGYLDQLSMYAVAGKNDPRVKIKGEAAFIAVDKEMGGIVIDKYKIKKVDYDKAIDDKRRMLADPNPPARPYDPIITDRGNNLALPIVPCGYCNLKQICYKDANGGKGLIGYKMRSGPRWFIKITKEPDGIRMEAAETDE